MSLIEYLSSLWREHARYHTLLFFVSGFVFDIFTLKEVDDSFTIISQLIYLSVALFIFILETEEKTLNDLLPQRPFFQSLGRYQEEIFHFSLGALLNAFILYFFKSSTFINSFLLLSFLVILLWLNEFRPKFIKHDLIPAILVHTCLLSFFVILAPTMIGRLGVWPFSVGLIFYLSLVFGWLKLRFSSKFWRDHLLISSSLVLFFLTLYLTRVFPPVPLSVREIGIYHKVVRTEIDGEIDYTLKGNAPRWRFWNQTSNPFIAEDDDQIYVFTRVFAPLRFRDTVFLDWWWKGPQGWMKTDRIPIEIMGGRREGFRGFAFKRNYDEGQWKVLVTTSNGLEVGRTFFEVIKSEER